MTDDLDSGQEVEDVDVSPLDEDSQELDNLEEPQEQPDPAFEDGDEPTAEQEEPEEPPRRNRAQERIDELTADKYQLKGQLDVVQKRLAELEARDKPPEQPPEPEVTAPPQAPTLAEFDGDWEQFAQAQTEWTAAMAEYARKQAAEDFRAQQEAAQRQTAEQARKATLEQTWNEQCNDARSRHPDFDVVALDRSLPVSQAMGEAIQELDNGADVLYWLGKNPERAARIAQMKPKQAAIQVGRISGTLMSDTPNTQPAGGRKVTSAPKPPSPTKSKGAAPERDPSKMSQSEYNRWRQEGGGR